MELVRAEELSNFLNRADNSSISREEISKFHGDDGDGAGRMAGGKHWEWFMNDFFGEDATDSVSLSFMFAN